MAIVPAVIVSDAVRDYLSQTRSPPDPVLAAMEEQGAREGIPIVVPETGALLHVLALAAGAQRVLEVGTAIGVSTLYLARALPEDGSVVSFEIDAARQRAAKGYLGQAGVAGRVDLRLQDAREGLRELDGEFDMAFVDGVKAQYGDYFDGVLPLLRAGGLLAVDNVLMSGTVADGRSDGHWSDEQIVTARAFNQRLLEREELTATITPVGDGVLIGVKLGSG
jgi:predicted O-methyltransferase YrrM